jgi:hypothetical protein
MAVLTPEEQEEINKKRKERREKGKGFARQAAARQEAGFQDFEARRAEQLAGRETGMEALKRAEQAGMRGMRRQAAAGLAAGQAAGAFGGGGTGASLRGAAAELGQQAAEFGAQQNLLQQQFQQAETARAAGLAEKAGEFGAVASVQGVEAEKFAAEAGSELEDRQRKSIEAKSSMAQIKKDHKGDKWWKSDDEEGAAAAIQTLADAETDPVIKKMYEDEAKRIRKKGNMAF